MGTGKRITTGAIIWNVWIERNSKILEDKISPLLSCLDMCSYGRSRRRIWASSYKKRCMEKAVATAHSGSWYIYYQGQLQKTRTSISAREETGRPSVTTLLSGGDDYPAHYTSDYYISFSLFSIICTDTISNFKGMTHTHIDHVLLSNFTGTLGSHPTILAKKNWLF